MKRRRDLGATIIIGLAGLLFGLALPTVVEAATPAEKRLSMEQRLTESDIAVALRHYERVCTELLDTRLRKTLAETEPSPTPAEKETQLRLLEKKIDLLEQYAKSLRDELMKAVRIDVTNSR
ncbi:MAG TPA: hypothetical protein VFV83_07020 [Chthoniobacteraceae bacterium]|nr:hypothetical protein [Chthoniobacteraceae bacterium]